MSTASRSMKSLALGSLFFVAMAGASIAPAAPTTAASAPVKKATVGAAAPEFTLVDSKGTTHSLSSFKGKTVVLEWFNKGCPFVKKHYESSNNMQALQKRYTDKGVVWLTVVSSAEGKQGFETPADTEKTRAEWKIASTATLLDTKGDVGRMYDAKTTPHMYVIDPKGVLVYNGAIDSKSSSDAADIPKAQNYVAGALDMVTSGKPVATASTKPYGCSVKY